MKVCHLSLSCLLSALLLSYHRDISKVIMQFVVEEIDENTSLEDLQKMMVVALVYRVLVCFYEVGECLLSQAKACSA